MGKINLNKGGKKKKDVREVKMESGSYEDLMKLREAKRDELFESIEKMFEDYNCEPMAIVIVKEDENGIPTGSQIMMSGAGRPQAQVALSQALDKASDDALSALAEGVASLDKRDMLAAIAQVAEQFGGHMEEEK